MNVTAGRAVALLASTAIAATLMGAPSHSSAPSTTWRQECPAASVQLPVAQGYEGAYEAFADPDNTCIVIKNTSDAILRVTVEEPNRVVFINGFSVKNDPRALPNEAGAAFAGLRSDTPTQSPVLRDGFAVVTFDPRATPQYWISAVDYADQVKAELAVRLSKMGYWWLPDGATQAAYRANLVHHVEACTNAAVLLKAQFAEEGRPTSWDQVFEPVARRGPHRP